MPAELAVLYEDNHCLAVAKPAGWLTMGDATGDRTLLDAAKEYIQHKYHKPGAAYLGVVHRLDRPVSGVVLLARTSKAAARLSEQFREHRIEKVYWALVTGSGIPAAGELRHRLHKNAQRNRSAVSKASGDGRNCELRFQRCDQPPGQTARPSDVTPRPEVIRLEIRPLTGRSHQIRAQLAAAGWPIVGDRKYGSRAPFPAGRIALHARSLTFEHPTRHDPVTVVCPPPPWWRQP